MTFLDLMEVKAKLVLMIKCRYLIILLLGLNRNVFLVIVNL